MGCKHKWYSLLDGSTICPTCGERRPSIYQFTHPYRQVSTTPKRATPQEFWLMVGIAAVIGFAIGFTLTVLGF